MTARRTSALIPVLSALVLFLLLVPVHAEATSITVSNTYDWGTGVNGTQTFDESATGYVPPAWSHMFTFSPSAISITGATVDLRHTGNKNNPTEIWLLTGPSATLIGTLGNSDGFFLTDTFTIPAALYPAGFPASGWTLALTLGETQTGPTANSAANKNTISLDYSTMWVTYDDGVIPTPPTTAPVPEPASLVLLGGGLVGLAMVVRRRQRRA